jgi:dihydropyrimidinase
LVELDTVVTGGTVAGVDALFRGDVGIRDGRIVALGEELGGAERVIDATGCLVLPGAIDAHTHFETSIYDSSTADDFESGSRAAAFGGITTFINFAFQGEGESLNDVVEREVGRASARSVVDFAFHVVITDLGLSTLDELRELAPQGFCSIKLFAAIDDFRLSDEDMLTVMRVAAEEGIVVGIHAEDGGLVNHLSSRALAAGRGVEALPYARPPAAEALAVDKAVAYARATDCELYVVHLSSHEALQSVRRGRANGASVYVETRPTYLFLTSDVYDAPGEMGRKYVFRPPLRDRSDQEALWLALRNEEIQVYATDHTSWSLAEKLDETRNFAQTPGGVSLVETSLGMLYSEGVRKGRLSLQRMVALTSTNPAQIFGLWPRKGAIAVGADADIVLLDPERQFEIRAADLNSRSDYDPYEGFTATGWPVLTMSRGEVVVDHGEFVGDAGRGLHAPRTRRPVGETVSV